MRFLWVAMPRPNHALDCVLNYALDCVQMRFTWEQATATYTGPSINAAAWGLGFEARPAS